jgi:nitroreductase
MAEISPQQLIEQLTWRYAVKKFDPAKTIPAAIWQAIEQAIILTPSSYGLQPWKFVVITDPDIKSQLPAISWNQFQPRDCSHMVVLAARETMNAEYVDSYMNSVCSVRGLPTNAMSGYRSVLVTTIEKMETHLDWNARQVYIALGQLMVAAALLGVDACPMEGIVAEEYDKLLELEGTGYKSIVACALGYRHPEDKQSSAKKVRFSDKELIVRR